VSAIHAERLDLRAEPSSVAEARAFVVRVLADWALEAYVDTAALITSELATNVVLHARTKYAVVVARTSYGAQIDVLDDSLSAPIPQPHTFSEPGGRGLLIVDGLAASWGPTPSADLDGFAKGIRFRIP
jgi:hypothetical protein